MAGSKGRTWTAGAQHSMPAAPLKVKMSGNLLGEEPIPRIGEVDFVTEAGGRLNLYEAKWTELPAASDTVNLAFVRATVGASRVAGGFVVCRARHGFPMDHGFRGSPVDELA